MEQLQAKRDDAISAAAMDQVSHAHLPDFSFQSFPLECSSGIVIGASGAPPPRACRA